jgi:hypothetical protein
MKRGEEARKSLPADRGEIKDAGIQALMDPAALESRLRVARAQRAQVLAARGKTDSRTVRSGAARRPPATSDVPAESTAPLHPVSIRPRPDTGPDRHSEVRGPYPDWRDGDGRDWPAFAIADIFQPLDIQARGAEDAPAPEQDMPRPASAAVGPRRAARSRPARDDVRSDTGAAAPASRARWPIVGATLLAGVALGVGATYAILPVSEAPPVEIAGDATAPDTGPDVGQASGVAEASGPAVAPDVATSADTDGRDTAYRPASLPGSLAPRAAAPVAPLGPRTSAPATEDAGVAPPSVLAAPAGLEPPQSPVGTEMAVSRPAVAVPNVEVLAAALPRRPALPQVALRSAVSSDPPEAAPLPPFSASLATPPAAPAAPRIGSVPGWTAPSPPAAGASAGPGLVPVAAAWEGSGPFPDMAALKPARPTVAEIASGAGVAADPPSPAPTAAPSSSAPAAAPSPAPAAAPSSSAPAAADSVLAIIHYPPNARDAAEVAAGALGVSGVGEVDQRPVNMTISRSNVRYYHAEDREVAQDVTAIVSLALGEEAVTRDFTDFTPRPSDSLVEIWIAGDAPDSVAAAPATANRPSPQRSAASRNAAIAAERERLIRSIEERLRQRLR